MSKLLFQVAVIVGLMFTTGGFLAMALEPVRNDRAVPSIVGICVFAVSVFVLTYFLGRHGIGHTLPWRIVIAILIMIYTTPIFAILFTKLWDVRGEVFPRRRRIRV